MAKRGLQKYTVQEAQNASLGQAGAIFHGGTDTISAPTGLAFTALQFIEDAVFNSTDGLTSVDDLYWPNSQSGATGIDTDGDAVDNVTFSAGTTIYGRWSSFKLSSGKIIAYLG
tara:strand:- start:1143 stop:1484 length:342 start_codon:yes stop_codon:yes gene_type:complete